MSTKLFYRYVKVLNSEVVIAILNFRARACIRQLYFPLNNVKVKYTVLDQIILIRFFFTLIFHQQEILYWIVAKFPIMVVFILLMPHPH